MSKKPKPLTNKAGEVRELSRADFRRALPAHKVLPELAAIYRKERGRPQGSTKTPISLRIDNEVLAFFKSKGAGWQTRIDAALKAIVEAAR